MTDTTTLLTPKPLYVEVAELIRQRIYSRELEPGSWIDEMKMAEAFGISRTPLREALKVLAAEGLVTMKVRRGAYVTEVSEKDLRDVYHLLSLLESDAAATVAEQATAAQLEQLQRLHQELEAAVADADQFFRVNEAFHMQLLALCDNRFLSQVVADLRKVMKLNRHQSLFKRGRIEDSLQEHAAIVQALAQRNPAAARQAMHTHFANGLAAAKNQPLPAA
ncbi:GntR family transcriptional regulator [Comamonas aquatica]|jgi:DNA-binding GntR family transcriptional regulator|uniref:GntR family transcriptional regulator n=1 Tax=Comamonas aquatica TaxID=225991 RepID=A0AA42W2U4_9BURK|nr:MULTISPECIES: GntR family transcriptional regulator [Comamonas]MDH1428631.1 GntR family transcriptional regulator [Comamonas aquatica]MDH1606401.1 GntR family transcriptional regulator [Comamonas aquatica]MDH1618177.1 GntR family transcriptional regulator [Comamonas aquatica]MDH1903150.1 GntR family transcriptional regulator [Comamonas aquatica]MDH2006275.1 GntR family transcriptional regulator [Comamonas aquatica]